MSVVCSDKRKTQKRPKNHMPLIKYDQRGLATAVCGFCVSSMCKQLQHELVATFSDSNVQGSLSTFVRIWIHTNRK